MKYFYDTYALIAYVQGVRHYQRYFTENSGITTKLNLMELYFKVLKDEGKEKAELIFDSFLPLTVEVDDEIIKEAMSFRLTAHGEKKDVSHVDAVGYVISLKERVLFLTGDSAFKGVKNVEFVR